MMFVLKFLASLHFGKNRSVSLNFATEANVAVVVVVVFFFNTILKSKAKISLKPPAFDPRSY